MWNVNAKFKEYKENSMKFSHLFSNKPASIAKYKNRRIQDLNGYEGRDRFRNEIMEHVWSALAGFYH